MQVVTTLSNNKRPPEYLHAIEELKKSFVKSIEIVNRLRDLGLKYGLSKEEIRRDIERGLEGVVKPRQLRSLLPLELKNVNKIRVQQLQNQHQQQRQPKPKKQVAAAAAANPPQPVIEFRCKVSKMGNRRIIGVPSYLLEHVEKLFKMEAYNAGDGVRQGKWASCDSKSTRICRVKRGKVKTVCDTLFNSISIYRIVHRSN